MALLTALLLSSPVDPQELAPRALAGGAAPDLTWMAVVVASFVVTIAAIAFGFRKLVSGSMRTRASKRDLRVLDVLPLGGKRQLVVVRCYDRTFALGLAEKSVGIVAELDTDAIEADQKTVVEERSEAFNARLASARARLLGVRDLIPNAGRAPQPTESTPQPKDSTREYIA